MTYAVGGCILLFGIIGVMRLVVFAADWWTRP